MSTRVVRIPVVMWARVEKYAKKRGLRATEALRMMLTKELDDDGS